MDIYCVNQSSAHNRKSGRWKWAFNERLISLCGFKSDEGQG